MPKDLRDFRMNDSSPFMAPADDASDRLREVRAMLLVLEQGFRTASDPLNPTIIADALEGISTLVALAQYHSDVASAEKQFRGSTAAEASREQAKGACHAAH